jgi:transcriptional regulator with XRE-family HTH domain
MKTDVPTGAGVEVATRILAARTRRGWSLAEVARRTGLSRAYINALEHGKSRRPGADAIRRLEDVLGPLVSPPVFDHLPGGLERLARERNLPASEIRALASLRIAGRQPVSSERWRFIYDALIASEAMDAADAKLETDAGPGEEG